MPRRSLNLESESSLQLDLSPLLDVVFILLIFFIVTAVFVQESGLEIQRPQAVSAETLSKKSIVIALKNQQEIWYGGANIGLSGLEPTIEQLLRHQTLPVVVQADKKVPTELLIQVLDKIKQAGAAQVHVATTEK